MKSSEIATSLIDKHHSFSEFINSLTNQEFMLVTNGKWTAGQQLQHIYLSVKPLKMALQLPGFLLAALFGKANRPSKSYDALIKKYLEKLENGGRATGRFVPEMIKTEQKQELIKKLKDLIQKISSLLSKYDEEKLDKLILPHPLLGKLTIREMMYFTIYHVQHHEAITKKNLANTNEGYSL